MVGRYNGLTGTVFETIKKTKFYGHCGVAYYTSFNYTQLLQKILVSKSCNIVIIFMVSGFKPV